MKTDTMVEFTLQWPASTLNVLDDLVKGVSTSTPGGSDRSTMTMVLMMLGLDSLHGGVGAVVADELRRLERANARLTAEINRMHQETCR